VTHGELGCEVCRNGWYSGDVPRRLGLSMQAAVIVFRCDVCGTYWFETERYAAPVLADEARRSAPDVVPDAGPHASGPRHPQD
jgi:hypothetical protein